MPDFEIGHFYLHDNSLLCSAFLISARHVLAGNFFFFLLREGSTLLQTNGFSLIRPTIAGEHVVLVKRVPLRS